MNSILGFIGGVIQIVFWLAVVLAGFAIYGYNGLRKLSESIREAMSNIDVVSKKQVSLINQLIDVVKGYQESEKLVMLKISDDMSLAGQAAQVYQQSNMVLSATSGIAQKFPELKSNEQYKRLIDSIQSCEAQLEASRLSYNGVVKHYNVSRSSMPNVFFATAVGFKVAPYLEFDGAKQIVDMGTLKSFSSDDDGDRLNALLGQAGGKMLAVGNKAIESSRLIAGAAQEKLIQIAQSKRLEEEKAPSDVIYDICLACEQAASLGNAFCGTCGKNIVAKT